MKVSVTFFFLRDGTFYFMALSAINAASFFTSVTRGKDITSNSAPTQFVEQLLLVLPSVLIQRFILNLRQSAQAAVPDTATGEGRFSRFSAPDFRVQSARSFLGNIGESLEDAEDGQAPKDWTETMNTSYQEGTVNDVKGSDAGESGTLYTRSIGKGALHSMPSVDAISEMSDIEEVEA
ncbi:hypothetical protein PsYK624_026300 [Phanerochaete sordida]|uniref:Uncharacterized protein n=1 Tax=Phanerochaete sordida TaxID=48140 RepID=A0A9P3G2M9_9APHY|nr:hypothetical protein PsYK624_026300 [Phanerochaete sordida]